MALSQRTALLHRRAFLGAGASLALAGGAFAAPKGFFARRRLPIGLQLYTLGSGVGSDLEATLLRVGAIGYGEVELPSYHGRKPAELRAAADKAKVKITSLHIPTKGAGSTPGLDWEAARLAADLRILGAEGVVVPMAPMPAGGGRPNKGEDSGAFMARIFTSQGPDYWKGLAELLNTRGAALAAEGVKLGYHNHNVEFAPVGETTGWDILVRETDPKLVSFELDVGWVAAAGLDPVAMLRRLSGRVTKLHVKDCLPTTQPNFALKMDPTEIGSGVIDWKRLLPAAYKAGVRHFYVEQEPPFKFERIVSVAKNYAFLSTQV